MVLNFKYCRGVSGGFFAAAKFLATVPLMLFCALSAQTKDGGALEDFLPDGVSFKDASETVKPLLKAKYVWSFSERDKDSVELFNGAQTGRLLRGLEFVKSTRRGGDGEVAYFPEGGYVIFGRELAGKNLAEGLGSFSLHLRMHSKWGHWRYALLASIDPKTPKTQRDIVSPPERGSGLAFNWYSDNLSKLLTPKFLKSAKGKKLLANANFSLGKISVHTNLRGMDVSWWHEFTFVYDGVRLRLYVDGVLLAENYPISKIVNLRAPFVFPAHSYYAATEGAEVSAAEGKDAPTDAASVCAENKSASAGAKPASGADAAKPADSPAASTSLAKRFEEGAKFFEGDLDIVAFWPYALDEDEICALSESRRACELLKMDYIGLNPDSAYMFSSPSPDALASLPAPLFFKRDFHVFYSSDKLGGLDKWGMGGAVIEHFKTDEIGIFQILPCAAGINSKFQNSNEYPDAVEFGGKILLFHSDAGNEAEYRDNPSGGENIWISSSPDGVNFTRGKEPAIKKSKAPFCVFEDGRGGLLLFMSDGGTWHSADAEKWTKLDYVWKNGKIGATNWLDVFKIDEYWRMVLGDGCVFKTKDPLGVWTETGENFVGGLKYPRVAVEKIRSENALSRGSAKAVLAGVVVKYGRGGVLLQRNLSLGENGDVRADFPRDSLPESGIMGEAGLSAPNPKLVEGDGRAFKISASEGTVRAFLKPVPVSFKMSFKGRFSKIGADSLFGVRFSASETEADTGLMLRILPDKRTAQLVDRFVSSRDRETLKAKKIIPVKKASAALDFSAGKTFGVEILYKDGVADLYIDGVPLSAFGSATGVDCAEFFAKNCSVEIFDVNVEPAGAVLSKGILRSKDTPAPKRTRRYNR